MTEYCEKGSKRMLQLLKSEHIKDFGLDSVLEWLSPTEENNKFHEHQLNNKIIMEKLDLEKGVWDNFWPGRQPQWDGIILTENTVYLIEAKSHLKEFVPRRKSDKNASDKRKRNNEMICTALKNVAKTYNSNANNNWLTKYYQVANRLAFLEKLKELLKNKKEVQLIFLNFINDPTWEKEKRVKDEKEWSEKYQKIFKEMGIRQEILKRQDVIIKNIDASSYIKAE